MEVVEERIGTGEGAREALRRKSSNLRCPPSSSDSNAKRTRWLYKGGSTRQPGRTKDCHGDPGEANVHTVCSSDLQYLAAEDSHESPSAVERLSPRTSWAPVCNLGAHV